MRSYRIQEADLTLPEAWADETINAFVLPRGGGDGQASFVVTRDRAQREATLEAYCDAQLVEAAKKLGGFQLGWRRPVPLDGAEAMELDYAWTTPEGVALRQRQIYAKRPEGFLIFTLTARRGDYALHERGFVEAMASIRLGQR